MVKSFGTSVNRSSYYYFFACLYFIIFVSALVGVRDLSVGTDSVAYVRIFDSILSGGGEKYEVGFVFFVRFVSLFSQDFRLIFFSVCFVVTFFYFFSMYNFSSPTYFSDSYFFLFVSLSVLCLVSSWYLVAVTNGIRQGVSLSLLYFSLSLMYRNKTFSAILFYVFSLSFHYSSVLVLPVYLMFSISKSKISILWALLALGYVSNINESLVKFISDGLGIPLYYMVAEYAEGATKWVGFDWSFFLYTIFWGLVFDFVVRAKLVRELCVNDFNVMVKVYKLLTMPYFILGFAGFPNRYAFIGWFFIPMVQALLLSSLRYNRGKVFPLMLVFWVFFLAVFSFKMFGVF